MAIDTRDNILERLLARLERLEEEKAQSACELAALKEQVGALRPPEAAGR